MIQFFLVMSERDLFIKSIKRNRNALIGIMMLPVVGMILAIILILWRTPQSAFTAVPIILVLMFVHGLLVRWLLGKMNALIEETQKLNDN